MPEQEPDRIAFQVTAEAVPRETMYLRRELAEGKYGESKFLLTQTIPSSCLLLEMEGERWLVTLDAIVHPLLDRIDALHVREDEEGDDHAKR
jgi:hypothetical protein